MLIYYFLTLLVAIVSSSTLLTKKPINSLDKWILYDNCSFEPSDICFVDAGDTLSNKDDESDCSYDKIDTIDVELDEMLEGVELDPFTLIEDEDHNSVIEDFICSSIEDHVSCVSNPPVLHGNGKSTESLNPDSKKEICSSEIRDISCKDEESKHSCVTITNSVLASSNNPISFNDIPFEIKSLSLVQRIHRNSDDDDDDENSSLIKDQYTDNDYDSKNTISSSCLFYYFPFSRCTCAMFCCCLGGTCDPFSSISNSGTIPPFCKGIHKKS